MVTICCIKWGNKFGPEYVNKLYGMVKRNISHTDWDFVCMTEDVSGINPWIRTAVLPCGYPGWWQKVGLFRNMVPGVTTEKLLFLDLDVVITRNIEPILNLDSDFAICRDWPPEMKPLDFSYNSSVILLRVGSRKKVWNDFDMSKATPDSDQFWIWKTEPGADLIPYDWTPSYKLRKLKDGYPPETMITIFHGHPKPPQCNGWVQELWRE